MHRATQSRNQCETTSHQAIRSVDARDSLLKAGDPNLIVSASILVYLGWLACVGAMACIISFLRCDAALHLDGSTYVLVM